MKYLIIFLFLLIPINVNALEINSKNAILYNMNDDTILFEKEADSKTYIASLTKIMTGIVAIENIKDINDTVTIPYYGLEGLIEANAAIAGFKLNQKVTYEDLLYGLLLPSGADAAKTLAYYIAGSEENFVKLMNDKAAYLGLTDTNFVNTNGLDIDNHYSTVKDVSVILKYALKNDIFKKIYTSLEYITSYNSLTFKSSFLEYTNRFNLERKYIYGSKTGYTDKAGYCLSSIANINGVEYLLITTGASPKSNGGNFIDAYMIYDYYSNNYSYINIVNENDTLLTLDTKNSKQDKLEIKANKTISKYLNNTITKDNLIYDYDGLTEIDYFNDKGQIGTLNIKLDNEILTTIPIIYNGELSFSLLKFFINNLIIVIPTAIILFLTILIIFKLRPKKS